jgi:hypothetical protein
MLIDEQSLCLLRFFCVYLTPAPRNVVDVEDFFCFGFMILPCSSWLADDAWLLSGNWG